MNLAGRGLSERPQRDLRANFRWPTRPGRPAERRSEALINWGGRMVPIKIRSLGEFFNIKFWCYQKKKNRKKLQKLVLRFGTTGKKFGPKIFGGRPQVIVFSIPRDFVLEKFRAFGGVSFFGKNPKKSRFKIFVFGPQRGLYRVWMGPGAFLDIKWGVYVVFR